MPRSPLDIDFRTADAAKPRKRSRKDRKKPEPPAHIKAGHEKAQAFADSLPLHAGIAEEPRGDGWRITAPHNDTELWTLQLVEAFGTRSESLIQTFVDQLAGLCPQFFDPDRQKLKTSERDWNAVLALVAEHQPQNSMQAALAAQMAAVHLMTMKLSSQALNRGHYVHAEEAKTASRLARTFAEQCETMQFLKGQTRTAKQSIHVTRETSHHVHYHDHRGGGKNSNQPQEPVAGAKTITGSPALPGDVQIDGKAVPCPSRKGQDGVP